MPRVPTYESQGPQPTIRQGEARQVITAEQASLPGRQMQEVGEAMGRVGSALGQYVLQRQNDLNEALGADALNQIEKLTQEGVTSYEALPGLNAIRNDTWGDQGPISFIGGELRGKADEIINRLNPAVQQYVRPRVDATLARAGDRLNRHFNTQSKAFEITTWETVEEQAQQAFIANPNDPEIAKESFQKIREANERLGRANGLDQKTIDLNAQKSSSEAVVAAYDGLLDSGNIPAAEKFLEQYKSWFEPEALVKAQNAQKNAGAVFYGRQDADQVLRDYPVIRDDNKARARDAALLAAATTNGVVDERRLDASRTVLNRNVNAAESDIAANDARSWERFLDLYQQDPDAALLYAERLPPRLRDNAVRHSRSGGQTTLTQQRAYREISAQPDFDPVNMNELQFAGLRPVIGEDNWSALAEQRQAGQRQQERVRVAMGNVTIDQTTLNYAMRELKIPSGQKLDFEISARRAVAAYIARTGQTPTDEEVSEIILQDFSAETQVGIRGVGVRPFRLFSAKQIEDAIEKGLVEVSSEDTRRLTQAAERIRANYLARAGRARNPDERQRLEDLAASYDVATNRAQVISRMYLQELSENAKFSSE
jgi:hypothetical protein